MKINENLTLTRYYEDELAYPFLCGVVYLLTKHNTTIMLLTQIVYTSFIPIFVYLLAKSLFDVQTARLSAVLSALSPGIIVYAASKIHSMTFYSLVFCMSLVAAVTFLKKQDPLRAIFLGAMAGLAVLSRNNFILFIPFLLLYLLLQKSLSPTSFLMISAAALVVLFPLMVRNYKVYQKIVILKPAVTWPAMNPKASGTLYNPDGSDAFTDVNQQLFSKQTRLTDLEYTALINQAVYSNIGKNKIRYLFLCLKRIYYFWWFSPNTGREYPRHYLFFYKPYYLFVLIFALVGIFSASRNFSSVSHHWVLLLIFVVATTFPHYLYYGEGRHRFALEPLLLIFTSYGLLNGRGAFRSVATSKVEIGSESIR